MKVIPPLTITDALLTSSSIPEVVPTVWSNATTYNFADEVYVAGSLGLRSVYQSIQAANLNHTPNSSPTWWQYRGDIYQPYSAGSTYTLGEKVQDNTEHKIYESLVSSNLGNALSDATKWLLIGSTNKFACFDTLRNTQSITPVTQWITVTPTSRIDSVAFMGMDATSITITVTNGPDIIYFKVIDTNARSVSTWYEYFFNEFSTSPSAVVFDVPPQIGNQFTFTIQNDTGNVKTGAIVMGMAQYIGAIQWGAESDVLNFSSIERDFAGGVSTLVQRRNVPKTLQAIMLPKVLIDKARRIRDDLNAIPAVWSGLDDDNSEFFESLLILGIYRRFSINLAYIEDAVISLELEEI